MPLYIRLLMEEFKKQVPSKIIPKANKILEGRFSEYKKKLMEKFNEHPVTQELEAGSSSPSSFMNVGNLFSLLGFYHDEKPTEQLKKILDKEIYLDPTTQTQMHETKMEITKRVWIPSQDDIKDKLQSPGVSEWTDRSWLDLIERGIPGFPWFLSNIDWHHPKRKKPNFKTSRSGTGIEIETNLGHGSLGPIKYIRGILENFKNRIMGK
jgi:hypothetical protein